MDRRSAQPELEVRVELARPGSEQDRATVGERLTERLLARLRPRVGVAVGEPGAVPRSEGGKAVRVFPRTTDGDPLS